jgi:DDE superfamily endonuclease
MNMQLLDLYSDYLLSSFGATTATGLSKLLGGSISHDAITRMLSSERQTSKDFWRVVKPLVREISSEKGVMTIDDSIEEKPYSDENELVCWHYDHSKGRNVKGINFMTAFYQTEHGRLPVGYELVAKPVPYCDLKTKREKRRSLVSKNEYCRRLLAQAVQNGIPFGYVITDVWYASAENIIFIKNELKKDIVMPLKSNRKVALSLEDKRNGRYVHIDTLEYRESSVREVYLETVPFPVHLVRQIFTNEDNSTGCLYLITTDLTMTYDQIITTYQKRWGVEVFHKSVKQNASLCKSPTHTVSTQANHFFAALCAYTKLERLSVSKKLNQTALKTKLYVAALQQAFEELRKLQPIQFQDLTVQS